MKKRRLALTVTFTLAFLFIGAVVLSLIKNPSKPSDGSAKQKAGQSQQGHGGVALIHIPSEILKQSPLTFASLKDVQPYEEVLLPGVVQHDPLLATVISARVNGRISSLEVKEADAIRAGQTLAIVQSSEIAHAQAEHLKSLSRFELATHQFKRSSDLFRHQIVSARDHELDTANFKAAKAELEASRIHLENLGLLKEDVLDLEKEQETSGTLRIRSQTQGWVIERRVGLGQPVTAKDVLFVVGRTDRVWIVLNIYEKDIPLVHEGMAAEVWIPAVSQEPKFKAKVARISHQIDPLTRSAKVWLEVSNVVHELKFGQTVTAHLEGISENQAERTLSALPAEAVQQIEGESIVFVKMKDNAFQPREVRTGWRSDRWIEIQSGLNPNEQVVSKGAFILKSEFLKK